MTTGMGQSALAKPPDAPEGFLTARDRDHEPGKTVNGDDFTVVYELVADMIKTCYDPEIPVDIWELGLIYVIKVNEDATVKIDMTLTSPMCPVAESLPPEVEHKIEGIPQVKSCEIELVWMPAWSPDMMSEEAKMDLGFDDY